MQRAKELAIKRAIADHDPGAGIRAVDLREAVRQEYRENEVFPPSDSVEDWLKLLDYEPENVVKVTSVHTQVEKPQETRSGKVI